MFACRLKFREVQSRAKIIHQCKGSLKGLRNKYKFLEIYNRHKI